MHHSGNLFAPDLPSVPATSTGKRRKGSKRKTAEEELAFQIKTHGLPEPAREWRFAKSIGRQWRFDFAFLDYLVAVEVEGLVVRRIGGELVVTGRHASIKGFREDCHNYASAALLGWAVLRFEQQMVKSREAIEYTMRVLASKGWKP